MLIAREKKLKIGKKVVIIKFYGRNVRTCYNQLPDYVILQRSFVLIMSLFLQNKSE